MRIKIDPNDKLFSIMVRERDGRCVFCGRKEGKLENSHFWNRGNKSTRFDARNCDTLCYQCHVNNEGNKQGFYRTWKIGQLGKVLYGMLEKKAIEIGKYGEYEKELIFKELTRQYKAGEHLLNGWKGIVYRNNQPLI